MFAFESSRCKLCVIVRCNEKVRFSSVNGESPSSYSLDRFNLVRKVLRGIGVKETGVNAKLRLNHEIASLFDHGSRTPSNLSQLKQAAGEFDGSRRASVSP